MRCTDTDNQYMSNQYKQLAVSRTNDGATAAIGINELSCNF